MVNNNFSFDKILVDALQDLDSIPTTEPDSIPGISGRLYIVAPEQKEKLEHIVSVLGSISEEDFLQMNQEEKQFYSLLLNNAERVLKNSISRPINSNRINKSER